MSRLNKQKRTGDFVSRLGNLTSLMLMTLILYLVPANSIGTEILDLNGEWLSWSDPQTCEPITVPFSNKPKCTITAYQKLFTIPPETCTNFVLLRFEGVVGEATVYLNGIELGQHGSYTPFWFDVTDLLARDGENNLIVELNDIPSETSIPHIDRAWVNYSGISRSVILECSDNIVLLGNELQYDFNSELTAVSGKVTVTAAGLPGTQAVFSGALLNGEPGTGSVIATLEPPPAVNIDSTGVVAADLTFSLDNPQLWSPDSPTLYYLNLKATVNDISEAEKTIRTGFREIKVEGNGLTLNGSPLFLKGVTRHDIYPGTGFVGTQQQMVDDMQHIKAIGANWVRLIHYPHHPRILELADELGLLTSEEVPVCAFWDEGVRQRMYVLAEEMVRRDTHHPSVFLWLTGCARAHPLPYALEAQQLIKNLDRNRLCSYVIDNDEYDPDTIAADVQFFHDAHLDLYLKITWWFYYVEFLQDAWANFPKNIPTIIAEFGREGNDREPIVIDGEDSFWWGEDQQNDAITEMLEAWRPHLPMYNSEEYLTGMCLFNYQDLDWPDVARYLPNHIPSIHWGLVYDDREPKKVLQTLTDFYTTLPSEFVGLPTPQDAEVENIFGWTTNLGQPLNDSFRDSGPSVTSNGQRLYFASDGNTHVALPKIFFSDLTDDGKWSAPRLVDMPQETEYFAFRRSPCISSDGTELFFTRALVSGIYVAQTRIFVSTLVEGQWSEPQDLGDIVNYPDSARITSDPSISSDGSILYFSSDRPGGEGRTDIWMATRDEFGWQTPTNMGPVINSPYGDSEPSISTDGKTLFFSSDRPGGMGSSDIWVTHFENNSWTTPKNLGPELNSAGADREPEVTCDGKKLLFAGSRPGSEGLSDIWQGLKIEEPVQTEIRLNCGVEANADVYFDYLGNQWIPEQAYDRSAGQTNGYIGGIAEFCAIETDIDGTQNTPLFNHSRTDFVEYRFDLPVGFYVIRLGFAELCPLDPGQRFFDIIVEDIPVRTAFDITAEVGLERAIVYSFPTVVLDGTLNLKVNAIAGTPLLANVCVLSSSPDTTPPARPASFHVAGIEGSNILTWIVNTEPDLAGYQVYRAEAQTGPFSIYNSEILARDYFQDFEITGKATYFYKITAVDIWGNESSATEILAGAVSAIPGDLDDDNDIDLRDYSIIQTCFSGRGIPQSDPQCLKARIDADNDVDLGDLATLVNLISGPVPKGLP